MNFTWTLEIAPCELQNAKKNTLKWVKIESLKNKLAKYKYNYKYTGIQAWLVNKCQ